MSETKENCRKIALWLEPMPDYEPKVTGHIGLSTMTDRTTLTEAWNWDFVLQRWLPRDFYRDEAANALVLEKLAQLCIDKDHYFGLRYDGTPEWIASRMRDYGDGNADMPKRPVAVHADRKTAIVLAALKFIEGQ